MIPLVILSAGRLIGLQLGLHFPRSGGAGGHSHRSCVTSSADGGGDTAQQAFGPSDFIRIYAGVFRDLSKCISAGCDHIGTPMHRLPDHLGNGVGADVFGIAIVLRFNAPCHLKLSGI